MNYKKILNDLTEHVAWAQSETRRVKDMSHLDSESLKRIKRLPRLDYSLDQFRKRKERAPKKLEIVQKYHNASNRHYLTQFKQSMALIGESNGSRYYKGLTKPNVAIVCSEFMYEFYKDAMNLHYVTPTNAEDIFAEPIDFFLILTSWKGLYEDEWRGISNPDSEKRESLYRIIDHAKSRNVPVVMQSTEDPSNYSRFIGIAQRSDVIFTGDEGKISEYQLDCGHDRIGVLEFGVNPKLHNPIGTRSVEKIDGALFAGSWMEKYSERTEDIMKLLNGVLLADKQLDIIDRNYSLNDPRYHFPEEFAPYVAPSVNYVELQKLSKSYDWVLNVNSIKYSPTMCARRVYESQALGNLILSNYSVAVNNYFPNIFIATNEADAESIMSMFTADERYEHQMHGVRNVMSQHTVYHRLQTILSALGHEEAQLEKSVLVVGSGQNKLVQRDFEQQSYSNKTFVREEEVTAELVAAYDMVTYFNDQFAYGPYYLEDLVNGFKYTDVDFITQVVYKEGHEWNEGIEHVYTDSFTSRYTTLYWTASVPYDVISGQEKNHDLKGYAVDRFSLERRIAQDESEHEIRTDYKMTVVIPVYNNGKYLYNKCFLSLKRSSMFKDMEIIIVDDGSSDIETIRQIRHIEENYANVTTHLYEMGGSGSASRPRNKGVEMSTTDYIVFLDPDNEATEDGYAFLYQLMEQDPDLDFATGHMKKLAEKESPIMLPKSYQQDQLVLNDPRQYLLDHNFSVQSIQAMVIRKSFIEAHQLEQVVGAVGQDSLFFTEMMLKAKKVLLVNKVIHDYYAAVSGSTVNAITTKYFEKCLLREEARAKVFKEEHVLDAFNSHRFEVFFELWYLRHLKRSNLQDFKHNVTILYKIYELFRPETLKNEKVATFVELYEKNNLEQLAKQFGPEQ
ncbi:glycosyltransferase [Exiguobacterium sp. SL-9]|uniref:glycosyltransferase n=1 Tax=Exiguobacterium sp. SL-9 TaxID=2510963 RepID=UPI00103B7420|nr:glycosyltransferase [Exiguobacterium sp. SL-9]TCI22526.1 glycosyltransferase [Exiguobacterium sp. SL-9]